MSANLSDEASSPPSKTSLQKWWKRFNKKPDRPTLAHNNAAGVFGVSLQDSLRYASVAISQVGPDGKARIYGHIPIVVAKTGLYLKENGQLAPVFANCLLERLMGFCGNRYNNTRSLSRFWVKQAYKRVGANL